MLGEAVPLIPIFSHLFHPPVTCAPWCMWGQPQDRSQSTGSGKSKKGVALFSYTSASFPFGDFAAWEKFPLFHHVCLEKKKHVC